MKKEPISQRMAEAKCVHFIGIGGISMSALAEILIGKGYAVQGSDRTESGMTKRLCARGAKIFCGHRAENIDGADVIVYTAAIPDENSELCAAREDGIPAFTRAELLGWLMLNYQRRIGVAGTHGKSTTTSMLAMILLEARVDPTVVSGAMLDVMDGAYRVGGEEYFLFEACEYKDSFLSFYPSTAVIGNIELDHTDYFPSLAVMEQSFAAYLSAAQIGVLNADDTSIPRAAQTFEGKRVTFGVNAPDADYRAEAIAFDGHGSSFDLICRGELLGRITLRVPGMHNVYNALAAAAGAMENGVSFAAVKAGLAAFGGASRRFEYRGTLCGAEVYDDYAHHPTEIRATLSAAKSMGKRVVCVFQPHTYSRTAELFDDFVSALSLADVLILADIYAAREVNTYGITIETLAEKIPGARCGGPLTQIAQTLRAEAGENDLILVMGAGDIVNLSAMLVGDC